MPQTRDTPTTLARPRARAAAAVAHPDISTYSPCGCVKPDDTALASHVSNISLGQREALSALYESTAPKLHAIARSVLRCPHDSEEVVGDVFMYVWHNSHRYDAGRGAVMGWLAVITRNRAIDRVRQRCSMMSLEDELACSLSRSLSADSERPDQVLTVFQETNRVFSALSRQSPVRRQLIALAFFDGLCHDEIAATTGLPLGTVKSGIRRTLKHLRRTLEI